MDHEVGAIDATVEEDSLEPRLSHRVLFFSEDDDNYLKVFSGFGWISQWFSIWIVISAV